MQKKYIVLMGAELLNKGAQSMIFTVTNDLIKRYPEKQIVMLSPVDYNREGCDKDQYKFIIEKHPELTTLFSLSGGLFKLASKLLKVDFTEVNSTNELLESTYMILDISGFALSSTSGVRRNLDYLLRIKVAKKFNVPMYVLPQSFGPFEYKKKYKFFMNTMIKNYLQYPKLIFAREKEGYDFLTRNYNLKNVKMENDIVLINKNILKNNIYKSIPESKIVDIKKDDRNVGIVPNIKNFIHGNQDEVIKLYKDIIGSLLNKGIKVYIVRHSVQDLKACRILKELFSDNGKVVLLEDDFDSFQFNQLVENFDFLIASRYHSIIHSYKNFVPCIAIGWATKYHELLSKFEQQKYIFDVRKKIDSKKIIKALSNMIENHEDESKTIKEHLNKIQRDDFFDFLDE